MTYTQKIEGENRPVNTTTAHEPARAYGPRIPSADLHARRIAREAERWLQYAEERTRMKAPVLLRKALDSACFSVRHRASSFAVPTKLVGTKTQQGALWGLVKEPADPWTILSLVPAGDEITVTRADVPLGRLQAKHVPWVRPLVPFGLRGYLARVTGSESQGYTLGCNVVLGHTGVALSRLLNALGSGGDGRQTGLPQLHIPSPSGDGDSTVPPVPVLPRQRESEDSARDVVLWRVGGTAHASVPHVIRHSPTGIEWGYLGAGPADLALSVLADLTSREEADRLYQRFQHDVIARVPEAGGVLPVESVRAWIDAHA